jgi:hypothetical protein
VERWFAHGAAQAAEGFRAAQACAAGVTTAMRASVDVSFQAMEAVATVMPPLAQMTEVAQMAADLSRAGAAFPSMWAGAARRSA